MSGNWANVGGSVSVLIEIEIFVHNRVSGNLEILKIPLELIVLSRNFYLTADKIVITIN